MGYIYNVYTIQNKIFYFEVYRFNDNCNVL